MLGEESVCFSRLNLSIVSVSILKNEIFGNE